MSDSNEERRARSTPGDDPLTLRNRALAATAEGVTISDFRLPDNPLIYANAGFERLTGYAVQDVLGKNCRFLQGPGTDQSTVDVIRHAIREERECTVEILNYRKDGSTFWNRLSITPLRDAVGRTTHFIGIQSDVTERRAAEDALRKAKLEIEAANDLLRRDLQAAARIQQALLPSSLPSRPQVRFAWSFRPCTELAGDTLNVLDLDEDRVGLYLLDVSGHGVPAALLSVTLSRWLSAVPGQSVLCSAPPSGAGSAILASPVAVASELNRLFPFDERTGQFFTFFYGVLDLESHVVRYVSAGHPAALHLRVGAEARILETAGFPIGIVPTPDYEEREVELKAGDRLFLCSDGVLEARDPVGREFGLPGLVRALDEARGRTLEEALAEVSARVETWCGERGLTDDASMVALELLPTGGRDRQ
jgi:PAS domain S-box-containing protein